MPKHWLLFLFRLQFFKIEITSGCKIKELRKTWSNFIALHKLVCIMQCMALLLLVTSAVGLVI